MTKTVKNFLNLKNCKKWSWLQIVWNLVPVLGKKSTDSNNFYLIHMPEMLATFKHQNKVNTFLLPRIIPVMDRRTKCEHNYLFPRKNGLKIVSLRNFHIIMYEITRNKKERNWATIIRIFSYRILNYIAVDNVNLTSLLW